MQYSLSQDFKIVKLGSNYQEQDRIWKKNKNHRKRALDDIVYHLQKVEHNIVYCLHVSWKSIDYPARCILIEKLHVCVNQRLNNFFMNVSVNAHKDESGDILSKNCGQQADGHDKKQHGYECFIFG